MLQAGLLAQTRTTMPPELVDHAWKRILFTSEIPRASVYSIAPLVPGWRGSNS
jgi:hypothetical protein